MSQIESKIIESNQIKNHKLNQIKNRKSDKVGNGESNQVGHSKWSQIESETVARAELPMSMMSLVLNT